jgi:guanosine-3',5'-bis(diphosphate) 3'-pyrophosphohydrolase
MNSVEARLLRAAVFAARKHRDQRRKNALHSPYINHPLEVAALLAEVGQVTDLELLTAALLHDTVEDTTATFDEIEALFGTAIMELVAEVTDDPTLPKQQRKDLQVEHAPALSARAKQLKVADKTSNIRDMDADNPDGWDLDRKREYLRWGQAVVAHCRGINPALDDAFDQAFQQALEKLGT